MEKMTLLPIVVKHITVLILFSRLPNRNTAHSLSISDYRLCNKREGGVKHI